MVQPSFTPSDKVLVLGATGFVGRSLVAELLKRQVKIRVLARSLAKVSSLFPNIRDIEVVEGDVLANKGLVEALQGIHTAFYLIHSLGGQSLFNNTEFASQDRTAAINFVKAADLSGLKRVIYLGGLGEEGVGLSEHLSSRAEVGKILASGKAVATILRAAVIIGAGGASFEMLRHLVERLPVMVCPRWIETRIQPIAVKDVISYLVGCLFNAVTTGQTFDIGGPEILTYHKMMQEYAAACGLARRLIVVVPFLTPLLSSYWVDLVTPVPSGIAQPLIEGMKNEVICRDNRIDEYVAISKTSFREAVRIAVSEGKTVPEAEIKGGK
ncbi:MAG: NAD(P)H-binding protein [Dissulfurispiraceae bacterium]